MTVINEIPVEKLYIFTDSDLFVDHVLKTSGLPVGGVVRLCSDKPELLCTGTLDYESILPRFVLHLQGKTRSASGRNAAILIDGHALPISPQRYQLIELLRQHINPCPIIVVATHFPQEFRKKAYESGVSIVIPTGFSQSELLDSISAAENDWRASGKFAMDDAEIQDRRQSIRISKQAMWAAALSFLVSLGTLLYTMVSK